MASSSLPISPSSSALSDPPHPTKKRRLSSSSLSDGDDEDDEEDKPLAARVAVKTSGSRSEKSARVPLSHRGGKKGPAMKSKPQTGPNAEDKGETAPKTNGIKSHETKVKVEEQMDEVQLNRLATGVTVDSSTGVRAFSL